MKLFHINRDLSEKNNHRTEAYRNGMTRKIALCGMMTALAMIFGYIEAILPISLGIPGVKLGMANIVIVISLYMLPFSNTMCIQIARIVLTSFLFGNLSVLLYSLAGGLLSLVVMGLLKRLDCFSVNGVSIAGGVSHNIGQLMVAVIVVNNLNIVTYLPVLLVSGLITGFVIGIIASRFRPYYSK